MFLPLWRLFRSAGSLFASLPLPKRVFSDRFLHLRQHLPIFGKTVFRKRFLFKIFAGLLFILTPAPQQSFCMRSSRRSSGVSQPILYPFAHQPVLQIQTTLSRPIKQPFPKTFYEFFHLSSCIFRFVKHDHSSCAAVRIVLLSTPVCTRKAHPNRIPSYYIGMPVRYPIVRFGAPLCAMPSFRAPPCFRRSAAAHALSSGSLYRPFSQLFRNPTDRSLFLCLSGPYRPQVCSFSHHSFPHSFHHSPLLSRAVSLPQRFTARWLRVYAG